MNTRLGQLDKILVRFVDKKKGEGREPRVRLQEKNEVKKQLKNVSTRENV